MKNIPKVGNIQKKQFVLLALILSLLVSISAYFYYKNEEESYRKEKESFLKNLALIKSSQIAQWSKDELSDAGVISENIFFIEKIEAWINNSSKKNEDLLIMFMNEIKNEHGYEDIIVNNTKRNLAISTTSGISKIPIDLEKWVLKSEQQRKSFNSGIYRCEHHKKNHLDFISPIFDKNKKVIAVVVFQSDPNQFLYPLIKSFPSSSKSLESFIVKKEGEFALVLSGLRFKEDALLNYRTSLKDSAFVTSKAVNGFGGFTYAVDYRKKEVLAFLNHIPNTEWFMITQIDKDEIFENLYYKAVVISTFAIIIILFVSVAIALIYSSRQRNIFRTLWQTQQEYFTTLKSIGDAVITTSKEGQIQFINPIAEALTGWSLKEAKDKPVEKIFNIISEETRQPTENPVDIVLEKGVVVGLANHTLLITKDGKEIPIADSGAPIRDYSNNIVGVVLVFRDQTEERAYLNSINESKLRLSRAEIASKSGNWELDLNTRFIKASEGAALIYGLNSNVIEYEIIKTIALKDYRPLLDSAMKNLIVNNKPYDVEFKIKAYNNEQIKSIHSVAFYDNEKKTVFGVIQDITERKAFEEALLLSEQKYKLLSSITSDYVFYTIVHENGSLETIWVTGSFEEMTGYTFEEYKATGGWRGHIYQDDHYIDDLDLSMLKNNKPTFTEIRTVAKNGSIVWVKVYAHPEWNNEKNRLTGIYGAVQNIHKQKLAEEALKISEENYRTIFNTATEAIFIDDAKTGKMIDVNEAMLKLYGYETKEEVFSGNIGDLSANIAPYSQEEAQQIILKTINEGPQNFEWLAKKKDGSTFWIEMTLKKTEIGGKGRIIAVGRDITQRKRAEEALQLSEELFRSLAISTSASIFIIINENYEYVNNAMEMLTGYSSEELMQMKFWDIVHPDYIELVKQRNMERQSGKDVLNRYEFKIVQKGGNEIWIDFSAGNINWKGQAAVIGSAIDITERIKVEDALKESEKRYRLIAENTVDSLAVFDFNLNYIYISPSCYNLLGYTPDELFKAGVQSILTEKSLQQAKELLYEEMELEKFGNVDPNRSRIFESEQICKDGSIIYVEANNSFIRDSEGRPVSILSVSRDITKRKKLELELSLSEEKFRSLFQNHSAVKLLIDPETGNIIDANNAAADFYGWSVAEIKNMNITQINTLPKEIIKQKMDETKVRNYFEFQHRTALGRIKDVEVYSSAISIGRKTFLHSIVHDVTIKKKTENELIESEARLRSIINSTPDIICLKDGNGRWLIANDSDLELFCLKNVDYYGKTDAELSEFTNPIYQESFKTCMESDEKAWENKNISIGEEIIPSIDGTEKIYDVIKVPVFNPDGSRKGLVVFARNITELKHTEKELKKLSSAVEQSPFSIVVTDVNGNIEYVNPIFTHVSEYSREEVVGRNPKILQSGIHSNEFYKNLWDTILSGNVWQGEIFNKKKSGTLYWENVLISPITDKTGKISNFLAIKEDITEKKKILEQLTKSEEEFRSIWESSVDAMRLVDENGIIFNVNDAFCNLFEVKKENIIGLPYSIVYKIENDKYDPEIFRDRFRKKHIQRKFEANIILASNKPLSVELTNSFIEIPGYPQRLLSIFRDITEKKTMIEEIIVAKNKAEEMNRLKSHFFANMSHELRTPFVGIMGFAELLTESLTDSDQRVMAEHIYASSKRLTNTLNLILDMTKLEFNKTDIINTPTEIVDLIEEVLYQFEKAALQKNIALKKETNFNKLLINTDEKLLSEILINLVNNSIKFTNVGWVKILAQKTRKENEEWLILKVIDTGIGVPHDKKEQIWEDFRQASEGTNRSYEGTGLGLSIVKRYTELLNGNIFLEESSSNGSTFTLEIPINYVKTTPVNNAATIEDEPKTKYVFNNSSNKKILYVEDDPMAVEFVTRTLSKSYYIDSCSTSVKALENINSTKYDIILMDINLGRDIDGIQLTAKIRAIPEYKNTPIIALTAYAREEDKNEFLSKGMSGYLSKPFTIAELNQCVENILKT